jgi:TolB protein
MKSAISLLLFNFSLVVMTNAQTQQNIESSLVLLNIESGKEEVILKEQRHFEAPNWSRDGKYLVINSNGLLEKISIKGEKLGIINTGFANRCNNDHGFSFDGKTLIISHNDSTAAKGNNSRIFVLPVEGGVPKLVTQKFPSYWHGISRDGQTLVYCAMRNNNYDVYKINIDGGEETRLTDAEGLDDGPEYNYDGKWVYFNSHRTGRMHLYRMKPDGSDQEQLTNDEYDNWFGHPSPDGKTLVYISYLEDQKGQHPFGKDVKLRLFDVETRKAKDITPIFFGGQGTINVPSWSPDGKQIAYVRYKRI